jgi:hypothetical protein
VLLKGRRKLKNSLKLKSEEGRREHKCMDTKTNEGHNGTICSANTGTNNANIGTKN